MKKTIPSMILVFSLIFLFASSQLTAQMYWNQAATFAGNPLSYVSIPNSSSLNITGSFSIEAWINPANTSNKGVISKGGTLLKYAIRITGSRVVLLTNGASRLSSRSANLIPVNTWTHIAASYNSSSNEFKIFINGQLDTSSTVAGAAPTSNSDSLYIGFSGASTPFNGQLDEVRLWNREISVSEAGQYFRTSLGNSSGIYSGLVLSLPFQNTNGNGVRFSLNDLSGNFNNAFSRNVSVFDMSERPSNTTSFNESAELDGNDDYLAAPHNADVSPFSEITLECWFYPRVNQSCNLITKGNPANPDYALKFEDNNIKAVINGTTITANFLLKLKRWYYVSFSYRNGSYLFVTNDNNFTQGNISLGNINSGLDSLYIGGGPGIINDLNGYIDEIRISTFFKTKNEIFKNIYRSVNKENDPDNSAVNVSYNLDGNGQDNSNEGGNELSFRNNAMFSHPVTRQNIPVSPMDRNNGNAFGEGFYIYNLVDRLPLSGTSGNYFSDNTVNLNTAITDLNLFVALNHSKLSNLDIVLVGPQGDSVKVFDNNFTSSAENNLVTIFNDNADSTMTSNRYVSFSPVIKPLNNINSVFSGKNSKGKWRLRIKDEVTGDTGIVYAWGLQFNNSPARDNDFTLPFAIPQGFYDSTTNLTVRDTFLVNLRDYNSPYGIMYSDSAFTGNTGEALFSFPNTAANNFHLCQIIHRNSVEIWSDPGFPVSFTDHEMLFGMSTFSIFGGNIVKIDNTPLKFGLYGGDSNLDGTVDVADVVAVFNDANNFASGYLKTDMTGDDFVDASDLILTFNNAVNFISVISP